MNNNRNILNEDDLQFKGKKVDTNLDKNIQFIKDTLDNSFDLIINTFMIDDDSIKIGIIYMSSLIKDSNKNDTIIDGIKEIFENNENRPLKKTIKEHIHNFSKVMEHDDYFVLFNTLLSGDSILLIDGFETFYKLNTRAYKERSIEQPSTHIAVKGPKDSFTENVLTNVTLIRRRIKSTHLRVEKFIVGRETNTDIVIMYLKNKASDEVVKEVEKRIKNIKIDNIIDSSYVTSSIKDKQFCVFPTIYDNERPDVVAAGILEGKVAIIVDNTPFVLTVPTLFIEYIQSVEDFYHKSYVTTFFRLIRMFAFYIALLLPSIYIAATSMHSEIIPFSLLIRIATQREGLPFPSFVEALIMSVIYDILREAGVRMPNALGSAISIVGALILGESAVQAGIVSSIMVVIISITAISTLVLPNYNIQLCVSILRYVFIFLAALFGLYGIAIGILALYIHLCSARSFGMAYYAPFAPFDLKGQQDAIFRGVLKKVFKRKGGFSDKFPH